MRRTRGFTLIELLVVIGIMTLLISILLPVLSRVRESAHRARCASNLRQMGAALASYAADNGGSFFAHRPSLAYPNGIYWDPGQTATYIPVDQRSCEPVAYSDYTPAAKPASWPWENEGGAGGLITSLYPAYLSDGNVFVCPSVNRFAFANVPDAYAPFTDFSDVRQKISTGGTWQFWASYVGCVYSKMGSAWDGYGHAATDAYYIQGYFAFSEDYESPHGAMMWDVGSYVFTLGIGNGQCPNAGEGCHRVGGNTLFRDGSVSWRFYSWVK